jgi:C-terminal processing protease CtpA/Prc
LWAAPSTPSPTKLTPTARAEIVENAAKELVDKYVDAAVGKTVAERLKGRLQAGAYDRLEDPAEFSEALTKDLQSINHDHHLYLRYSPASGPAAPGPMRVKDPFADAKQLNFGLSRAEILDGNVGYMEVTGFIEAEGYKEAVVDALRFLSRTDAIIIDVRRNGGGSGQMSHFLFSHFLGPKPVPTIKIRSREAAEPEVMSSLAEVPGPRRPTVPLFVLTSRATFSAAEEFCFVLKNQHRATLIGANTGGAGHMVGLSPVGQGFLLGVSITQVSDPVSGLEWETVGVQPDVALPAELALAEAHAAALRRILTAPSDPDQVQVLIRLLAVAEARCTPKALDIRRLARFLGSYEGGRSIALAGDQLSYTMREGALAEPLTCLGVDCFGLRSTRFSFKEKEGKATLIIEQAGKTRLTLNRLEKAAK